jgi:iodotyrosine deiodinase
MPAEEEGAAGARTGPVAFRPLAEYRRLPEPEMVRRASEFADELRRRRSVRDFSSEAVPRGVIERCLWAAGSAPSGANLQPWHFVVVSDPAVKRRIREAAEAEEREFYRRRATREWLAALEPLGTGEEKPFLEAAPCLIAIFGQRWGAAPDGERVKHYYVTESVGIATGLLIAALHHAGLATLTHTPSPMDFLNEILGRPENERPFLLLVVGYPAADARVPEIGRKPLDGISTFV